jgi:hypothetical protein
MSDDHVYLCRIQRALLQANVWVGDLQEPESLSAEQILFAVEAGRALLQVLQDAQAAGISDQALVTLNNNQVTLSEVQALGESIAAVGRESGGIELK